MKLSTFFRALLLTISFSVFCSAAEDPSTVLILVNDFLPPEAGTGSTGASIYVGEYFAAKRGIPPQNVLHLNVPVPFPVASYDGEIVPYATFDTYIRQPLKAYLESSGLKNKIKYIVPTYGIPVAISSTSIVITDGVAIDSYLAALYSGSDRSFMPNPYAVPTAATVREHFAAWTNPNGWPMYLVTRLDGPSPLIATGLVDKALQAEKSLDVSSGIGYFDWRNTNDTPDKTMKRAYDLAVARGFPSVLNDQTITHSLFTSAPNTLWAWGWYSGPSTCNCYSFVNGAVGAQLTSYTAGRIRLMAAGTWVPEWLSAGITATWGATSEPFTTGYANGDNLLNHFWNGYNFAESAYLAAPTLNWMMVFVGDPLYSPASRVTIAGNQTGQSYSGTLKFSILVPTTPAVAGVQFLIGSSLVGPEITAPPYSVTVATDTSWDGPRTVSAQIRYTSGQISMSDPVAFVVNNGTATGTDVAAPPTVSPAAGNYNGPVTITPFTATPGATIHYTLDGSSPTESSPLVTGSVTLTATGWIRLRAFKSGLTPSDVSEFLYTISNVAAIVQVAAPTVSPLGGTYSGPVTVTPLTSTPGAAIHYTLDGSSPTENTPLATGSITLTASGWIRLRAFKSGMVPSDVSEYQYSISSVAPSVQVAAPTVNPQGGTYIGAVTLTPFTATPGAAIYYTLDGSSPTESTPLVTGSVTLTASGWIRFRAFKSGMVPSDVSEYFYSISSGAPQGVQQVAAPTVGPAPGTYSGPLTVTPLTATPGAAIHYTLDGSTPTESAPLVNGSVTLTASGWIRLRAFKTGMAPSDVSEFLYTISNGAPAVQVAAPTVNPAAGTYSGAVTVTPLTATPGATIYYTLDGSTPIQSASGTTGSVTLTTSGWIRFRAFKSGMAPSDVSEFFYNIQ